MGSKHQCRVAVFFMLSSCGRVLTWHDECEEHEEGSNARMDGKRWASVGHLRNEKREWEYS